MAHPRHPSIEVTPPPRGIGDSGGPYKDCEGLKVKAFQTGRYKDPPGGSSSLGMTGRVALHFRGKPIFKDFWSISIPIFMNFWEIKPVEHPRNQVSFHFKCTICQ